MWKLPTDITDQICKEYANAKTPTNSAPESAIGYLGCNVSKYVYGCLWAKDALTGGEKKTNTRNLPDHELVVLTVEVHSSGAKIQFKKKLLNQEVKNMVSHLQKCRSRKHRSRSSAA